MKSLDELKSSCAMEIDERGEHWIWQGRRCQQGYPMTRAPNVITGKSEAKSVLRAAWDFSHGSPVPPKRKIYNTCSVTDCVNPAHAKCGTYKEFGKFVQRNKLWVGRNTKIIGSRKGAQKRTNMTKEIVTEIQNCNETLEVMALRLNRTVRQVQRARSGLIKCFEPVGGMFTSLMAANTKWSARA